MSRRSPCEDCPFRSDIDFRLTPEKVQSILGALQGDGGFPLPQDDREDRPTARA